MPASDSVRVMDAESIARALTRVSHEIVERHAGAQAVALSDSPLGSACLAFRGGRSPLHPYVSGPGG